MASLPLLAGFAGPASHGKGPALTHTARGLLIVCAVELLLFAIPFGLAWLASRATKDDLLLRWRPGYWVVPLGAVYSLAIRMGAGLVVLIVATIAMVSTGASKADLEKFVQGNRPQVEKLVDLHAMSSSSAYYWLSVILVSFVIGGLALDLAAGIRIAERSDWRSRHRRALLWRGTYSAGNARRGIDHRRRLPPRRDHDGAPLGLAQRGGARVL